MHIIQSFLLLQMESSDMIRSIEDIRFSGIPIYNLKIQNELTAHFAICPFDFNRLKQITERTACTLRVRKKTGSLWMIMNVLQRKVFLLTCMLILSLTLYLPSRIFYVTVQGNETVKSAMILEAAEIAGIRLGASRKSVRSEKVKNALLEVMPQLQWVGVTTQGCVANITIREKNASNTTANRQLPERIIAERDGIIVYCTAVKGNLLCSIGQTVTTGETLISGLVDCGTWIRKTGAEGEVYAQTKRKITLHLPNQWAHKTKSAEVKKHYSVILGKKRINLWNDSGISDATYDRIYKEYYAVLPGGFQLPVALTVESCYQSELRAFEKAAGDVSSWLEEYAQQYMLAQMISGKIHEKEVRINKSKGKLCLTGEYSCTEMIGRVQRDELGASYE